ncbi:gp16 family protein [Varunaivibrio sulfuroxidans]|uniref:Phage gp16-like protein n=1 Tax=Varunaivibrio sulfuroxidans TaxID=1773489 RepID=A0A4R3JAI4_9PROT|nr:regulatory protein GemA [Varunaivibrio sulfuroxidans]TCS62567.1 phage gp16-like protein [Varunaivibrio sulfuroxidans]WES30764.1 regulatory protein GemA [Varunaivibrio sulfuroxidans]
MTAHRKYKTTPVRRGMIAKIKIAQKQLGWSDDAYRDVLALRFSGRRSATQLNIGELENLIAHMKDAGFRPKKAAPKRAGVRPLAGGEEAAKMRALWLSLYHLGVVRDPAERALAHFARRLTGKEALQWMDPCETVKVIEALKAMATRQGGVDWSPIAAIPTPLNNPRARVIEAQWRILSARGAVADGSDALPFYAAKILGECPPIPLINLTVRAADRVIEILGKKIRAAKGGKP